MTTPNYLDIVLWQFNHVIEAGWKVLEPASLWLFWSMAGIYLLWSCSQVCLKAKHPVEIVMAAFFAFLKVFFMKAAMVNLQRLTEMLVGAMTNIGLAISKAGGNPMTIDQFLSPGTVLAQSWKTLQPMINHWNEVSALGILWYAGPFVMYLISLLACIIAFGLISLHIVTALTTYKILSLFSYPLLGLGILPATSFIAKACLDGLIACAVRLGVLALVTSIIVPLMEKLGMPATTKPDFWSALSMASGAILLSFMSWKAPSYASEILGGRIATAAGDLIAMVMGASYGLIRAGGSGQRIVTQVTQQVREAMAEHGQSSRLRKMWKEA